MLADYVGQSLNRLNGLDGLGWGGGGGHHHGGGHGGGRGWGGGYGWGGPWLDYAYEPEIYVLPVQTAPGENPILQRVAGLGAIAPYNQALRSIPSPYRYGTRNWWIWYSTAYLPQYYSQSQVQQAVIQSPFYQQFGSPWGTGYGTGYQTGYPYPYPSVPTGYNYPYTQQQYGYQYPSYDYGYGQQYYTDPYGAQYTAYQGTIGGSACASQGGYWDPYQQTCAPGYGNTIASAQPPNTVGMPYGTAVALLNNQGWSVWLLSQDSVSGGVPQDYNPRRVQISVTQGVISGQQIG